MDTLEAYLHCKHSPETAKLYLRDVATYLHYMGEEKATRATYRDIMQYVDHLRKRYQNPKTINRMLYGVKAWYFWLLDRGIRSDHPCRSLTLRDAREYDIQLQDLFTSSELEALLERKERYNSMRIRNQVVMGLLIYQALRLKEAAQLRVEDIDLDEGTVYTRGMAKTLPRTLKMKTKQVMLFYTYVHEVRPALLRKNTDRLLLSIRGTVMAADSINYLVETVKPLYPDRNLNAKTIRQSVIANHLKEGKDLRVVQAFAGHKKPSATERYRQTGLEELKAAVLKHHPLG